MNLKLVIGDLTVLPVLLTVLLTDFSCWIKDYSNKESTIGNKVVKITKEQNAV